jgi:hypothetical protein
MRNLSVKTASRYESNTDQSHPRWDMKQDGIDEISVRYESTHRSIPPQVRLITTCYLEHLKSIGWESHNRMAHNTMALRNTWEIRILSDPNPERSKSWEIRILRDPNPDRSKSWQIQILTDPNLITGWPITLDLIALITIDLAMSMTLISLGLIKVFLVHTRPHIRNPSVL